MHPPANQRCQIFTTAAGPEDRNLYQCVNNGTHWEEWGGGCGCDDLHQNCEDVFFSWECTGPHVIDEGGVRV